MCLGIGCLISGLWLCADEPLREESQASSPLGERWQSSTTLVQLVAYTPPSRYQKALKQSYTRIWVLVYVRNRLDQHEQAMSEMCWLLPPFVHPIPWDNIDL